MRIPKSDIDIIKRVAREVWSDKVIVYLFGSRTDDSEKGGDIDLLIKLPEKPEPGEIILNKSEFLAKSEILLGEQKFDVVIQTLHNYHLPIIKTALAKGIELWSTPEFKDKLMQTFENCEIHLKRMEFASSKVEVIIPLTPDNYYKNDEAVSFIDQYIFRFSKLQDIIGGRLFPLTLEALAEPFADKPFIDILNRLEKLEVIDSALSWIQLRKIRNDVTHEYPALISEKIEGINLLFENLEVIKRIIFRCRSILD